jgi:hypothetical protein
MKIGKKSNFKIWGSFFFKLIENHDKSVKKSQFTIRYIDKSQTDMVGPNYCYCFGCSQWHRGRQGSGCYAGAGHGG